MSILFIADNFSKQAELPPREIRLYQAWPLIALGDVAEFADNTLSGRYNRMGNHPHIQYCYETDPVFTSELLLAISLFENKNPDPGSVESSEISKVSLIEALLWCEPPNTVYQSAEPKHCKDGKVELFWGEIPDWKTLSERIGDLFPQHRVYATAARLKTEFSREKKRREKILACWEANFEAYARMSLTENHKPRIIQVWENTLNLDAYE